MKNINVKQRMFLKDVVYSGISKYSTIIIVLIVTSILARLLSPSDFGVVAIATVFITFFNLVSDFGIATAVVQFKDLSQEDIKSIFGWTFWIAVVLSSSFYFCAPLLSSFYDNSLLKSVCQLLSLQIFFATLNIVPNALLLKQKKFNVIAARTLSIQILCGVASVAVAFNGGGIYSLLINPIVGMFLNLVINVFYIRLTIKLIPEVASIEKIFSFSSYQFLFNFINYIGNNLDKMIIGKTISIAGLGYYEKAYRLEQLPAQTVLGVVGPVLHPYLSDYQNRPDKILEIYNKLNRILLTISFPISAYCLLCAKELILMVFGYQWVESILYFSIMSITVTTNLATSPTGSVLQASNQTKLLFYMGTINVLVALIGLCIGAFVFRTILAICVIGVFSSIICFIITYYLSYKFCFKASPMPVFLYSLKPLTCFLFIGGLGYIIDTYWSYPQLMISLIFKTIIWLTVLIVFLHFFSPYKPAIIINTIILFFNRKIGR